MRIAITFLFIFISWVITLPDEGFQVRAAESKKDDPKKELVSLSEALAVFKFSEPWNTLNQPPIDRAPTFWERNRGAAFHLKALLNSKQNQARINEHYLELLKNKNQLQETAKRLDQESGEYYRKTLKFDVLRFLVELISQGEKSFHFAQSQFSEAYFSNAEGRSQLFQVVLPSDYSPNIKYPLFVQVFGSASLLPDKKYPFIRVRPHGRGVWGYRSMSRYDVMQVISLMQQAYNIDADRVYMTGTSAGATGMMHTAASRQHVFAGLVPLVAFGNDLPLKNFNNLPLRCEHGVNDWTSSIGNVRVQFQKLNKLGYPAQLNEHPTAGHGIRVPPPDTMEWLFKQNRNPRPNHIVYSCEHPRDGKAFWLEIEAFQDPHQRAHIDAKLTKAGLTIQTQNIKQFSLDLKNATLKQGETLIVDQSPVKFTDITKPNRLTLKKAPNWQTGTLKLNTDTKQRSYGAGAAANLFQGEPLLVIYGTGADKAENQFLRQTAKLLSRCGGPQFKSASVQFPIRADTNLKNVRLDQYNLLLVGTPENNAYLKKMALQFPFSVENKMLKAGSRSPVSLKGAVLGFHFLNPLHPKRLIYMVSPYLNPTEQKQFLKNPRRFLSGSAGFKMIDQADLLVRDVDLSIRREMQFTTNWKFKERKDADLAVPPEFSNRNHLALAHMKVMQKATNVDFALWWGPEDKGSFGGYDFNWLPTFDPKFYTRADYAVRQRETECFTATISGAELQDFYRRWIATHELLTWPKVKQADIKTDRAYSIVLPMDLVVKLGTRRKVLSNVAPGPMILPNQVANEIFATPLKKRSD